MAAPYGNHHLDITIVNRGLLGKYFTTMLDVNLALCRSPYTLTLEVVHGVVKRLSRLEVPDTHVKELLLHQLTIDGTIVATIHIGFGTLGVFRADGGVCLHQLFHRLFFDCIIV